MYDFNLRASGDGSVILWSLGEVAAGLGAAVPLLVSLHFSFRVSLGLWGHVTIFTALRFRNFILDVGINMSKRKRSATPNLNLIKLKLQQSSPMTMINKLALIN